jgi:protocatechuate 3,4-dioxygenase beta subunit
MKPEMEHMAPDDDAPVGRVLSRREVLWLLAGLGGVAVLAACGPLTGSTETPTSAPQPTNTTGPPAPTAAALPTAAATPTLNAESATATEATPVAASPTADVAAVPDCVVRPELTEGPYFVDEKINRSDIRTDTTTNAVSAGVPLVLTFLVSQIGSNACTPLQGAQVDVWHCDALGVYSGVSGNSGNFLRGYQATDATGKAQFTTVYPGWYRGRAVHIHFKIRTTGPNSQSYEFTSQFFFDDTLSDQVYTQAPYSQHANRDTRNANDGIYRGGGHQLLLALTKSGDGYATTFPIGLDLSNTSIGASDSAGQGGGGPGGSARP